MVVTPHRQFRPLTILLANIELNKRQGTQIIVKEHSLKLLSLGHHPIVYSPLLGEVAEEIKYHSIPVTDDIGLIMSPPDVIHGNQNSVTATAIARFPNTPAIFSCHDFVSWLNAPPLFPTLYRYIAVDELNKQRLIFEAGIPPEQVVTLLNAVDINKFKPQRDLYEKPKRALVYSKHANHLNLIQAACQKLGINLDHIGTGFDRSIDKPQEILANYDLVFSSAMSAIEALASGAAVIVCDGRGLAGMVTSENYEHYRRFNFGLRTLLNPVTVGLILAEIERYNPIDAGYVCQRIREEADLDRYMDKLLDLYHQVIAEHAVTHSRSPDSFNIALARHIQLWSPRLDAGWPWMVERADLLEKLDRTLFGFGAIHIEQTLIFSTAGTLNYLPISGFSHAEAWGIWTVGQDATLLIKLQDPPSSDLIVELKVQALLTKTRLKADFDLSINGIPYPPFSLHFPVTQDSMSLKIPVHVIPQDGLIWIQIRNHDPQSPAELGLSTDNRKLGLGLLALTLKAVLGFALPS